tara:strand:- start:352 stop:600 length:249 start_codon:yes stop_codon:yes gene_type:complete
MLTIIVYIGIACILIFVSYLAIKAISRGIEARSEMKKNNNNIFNKKNNQDNLSSEILKLKKMYEDGVISEEEFKKAKEKLLK